MKNTEPEVWAPHASSVELQANDARYPMTQSPTQPGWWMSGKDFPPGTRYGFLLDGEGPYPDPRSNSQPDGMHGLSEITDHNAFPWTDDGWNPPEWNRAVVYEAHVGTFSSQGTFEGMIEHLDHLVRLGVTHLELMPVCEFPGKWNWGYDGVSIHAPNHLYGGPDGLKRLIDSCHERGLAVVVDVVYNHMGSEGNYLPKFGPYFTGPGTAWGSGPTMEGEHAPAVRQFFIDNALMWLRDYHADGLRLDAIDKVVDNSAKHFLIELSEAVGKLSSATWKRVLIAESASNDPVFVKPLAEGGYGLDAHWVDDFHHATRTTFTGERHGYYIDYRGAEDLVTALRQGAVYEGQHSEHLGKPRGKSLTGLPPSTFLICFQNHDQIGNRPTGDRFSHHPEVTLIQQQIGSAFTLLSPFTPMIFMGEEWAASTPFQFFTDHQDPELAASVGEGRRKEFGGEEWSGVIPDPQHPSCYSNSKLIWEERHASPHREILGWYSELLRFRSLNGPSEQMAEVEADLEQGWIRMTNNRYSVCAGIRNARIETPFDSPEPFEALLTAGMIDKSDSGKLVFQGPGVIITVNTP